MDTNLDDCRHRQQTLICCSTNLHLNLTRFPGGFSKLNQAENHEGLENARQAVQTALMERQDSFKPLKVTVSGDVETQVVAGTNYKFQVVAEDAHLEKRRYHAQVWERLPHEGGKFEVTHLQEAEAEPGSPRKISPTTHEVHDAAAYALQMISETSNSLAPFQLKEVVSSAQSRNADGSVTHTLRLKACQGTMPDQTLDAVVVADDNGYTMKSSDVVVG